MQVGSSWKRDMKTASMNPPATRPQILAEFLHTCSPDPLTRTMAAASYALTLWQTTGRTMTPLPPSMLFINAGEAENDPLAAFADDQATGMGRKEALESGHGLFAGGKPENARAAMLHCIKERDKLGHSTPNNADHIRNLERRFRDAKSTGYGSGSTGPYSRMWDEEIGWISHSTDDIILHLDQPVDREAFRKDVLEQPGNLLRPVGASASLKVVTKGVCVSGSLTPAEWDDRLACGIVNLGLPVFFLPHLARDPLTGSNNLELFAKSLSFPDAQPPQPVVAAIRLPDSDWFRHYQRLLRRRLRELPGTYEFTVLRAVHELGEVCARIARHVAAPGSSPNEMSAIYMDLHAMAFRGIVMGLAGLAWHCLGFDPGCPRRDALKLLHHLRDKGPLSRRDIQRTLQSFNATQRDDMLGRLATEGLVELDGPMVTAVPLAGFIQALQGRQELREPDYLCPALLGTAE